MFYFEEGARTLKYPDTFSFPALDNALTGFMINDKGHKIFMALFLPHQAPRSILAISTATARILEEDKHIIDRALTDGNAVLHIEHYGTGLSSNSLNGTGLLGSKDFFEFGKDFLSCIEIAQAHLPNTPVNVLGLSMGALVAAHAVLLKPDVSDNIIFGSPFLGQRQIDSLNMYQNSSELRKRAIRMIPGLRHEIAAWDEANHDDPIDTQFDTYCQQYVELAKTSGDTFLQQLVSLRQLNKLDGVRLSKQWVIHAAEACHRIQKVNEAELQGFADKNITLLLAENDGLIEEKHIPPFARKLASTGAEVQTITYAGTNHNVLQEADIRGVILADVSAICDCRDALEPNLHDLSWYSFSPAPETSVVESIRPSSSFLNAAMRGPLSLIRRTPLEIPTSLALAQSEEIIQPSPATDPLTESEHQAPEPSSV